MTRDGDVAALKSGRAGVRPRTRLFFPPLLAPLLRERLVGVLILALGAVQVVLTGLGAGFWRCPFYMATGRPCPGCGLSRAMGSLLAGDLVGALRFHPFAPFFAGAILLLAVGVALPKGPRKRLADGVEFLERRSGLSFILLAGVVGYGVVRMFAV